MLFDLLLSKIILDGIESDRKTANSLSALLSLIILDGIESNFFAVDFYNIIIFAVDNP